MCYTANFIEEDDNLHDSNSAVHGLRQREALLRLQSMNCENENMACNTKEAYLTYLKLFQSFCDKTCMFEKDSRYEIYEDKVLVFFKDFMFPRKIAWIFKANDTKDVRVALTMVPRDSNATRRPVDLRSSSAGNGSREKGWD
ncbi:hypothetical protein FBU30_000238 [Linnemannia zychae]|nr:hypothetical protein FBU30_000238 [Linnemannia zychae]